MKAKKTMKLKVAIVSSLFGVTVASQGASVAIPGTGWNQDLVVENTTDFTWEAAVLATTTDIVGYVFYEKNWGGNQTSQGLLSSGSYVGPSGTSYQMQPYGGNNVILNSGTFNLTTVGQFSELAFLVTTQEGNPGGPVSWTATVHFSDASSTVLTGGGVDWTDPASTQVVVQDHGVAQLNVGFYSGNLYMVERTFALSPADQLKTVESIEFGGLQGNQQAAFHAISGSAVPEPSSSLALFSLGVVGLLLRRR